jgi:hypothetical protein
VILACRDLEKGNKARGMWHVLYMKHLSVNSLIPSSSALQG